MTFSRGAPLVQLDRAIVVAILIPHVGEGGAQSFVGQKKRSRMSDAGWVFGMRKS
jgi:hypothetical protein